MTKGPKANENQLDVGYVPPPSDDLALKAGLVVCGVITDRDECRDVLDALGITKQLKALRA